MTPWSSPSETELAFELFFLIRHPRHMVIVKIWNIVSVMRDEDWGEKGINIFNNMFRVCTIVNL
jgi:hypothetical protein